MAAELSPLELAAAGQEENGEIKGAWLMHYYDLVASGICSRKQAAYAAWYSAPKQTRQPKTQEELAGLLNYKSAQIFFKWRQQEWWKEAINQTGLALLEDYNADAHRRLIEMALNEGGSAGVAALRLYFERLQQIKPGELTVNGLPRAIENTVNLVMNLSDDELDGELERLEQKRKGALLSPTEGAGAAAAGEAAADDPAGQNGEQADP